MPHADIATYASHSLRDPGGVLSTIGELASADRRAVQGQLASPWADPALILPPALAGLLSVGSIIATQGFLRHRFRRMISPPLLPPAALVCALVAWETLVILPADAAFTAARRTALPQLTQIWQTQIRVVDARAAELRANTARHASGTAPAGLPVTAAEPASGVLDADLAAVGNTGGLPTGIPALGGHDRGAGLPGDQAPPGRIPGVAVTSMKRDTAPLLLAHHRGRSGPLVVMPWICPCRIGAHAALSEDRQPCGADYPVLAYDRRRSPSG